MEDRSLDHILPVDQVAPSQIDTFRHVERRAFFYALNPIQNPTKTMARKCLWLSALSVCHAFATPFYEGRQMPDSNPANTLSVPEPEPDIEKLADLCAVGVIPIPDDLPGDQQRKLMVAIAQRRRKR